MTDKELVQGIQSGNREALEIIIDKYYNDIYRFCRYYTGDETDSYDITQYVFFRFIKYAEAYHHQNLKGYLIMIARNLCMDYYKQQKESFPFAEIPDLARSDHTLQQLEDGLFLREILMKLPIQQREVILLREYEEMKFHEIAKLLSCNLSTVKSRFRLGILNIRKLLAENKMLF